MKVRYNSHASISITTDSNKKIITDPWFFNPIYGGMMWGFPQSKLKLSDYIDHDIVVISHIHPDHYCRKSLKYFDKTRVLMLVPDVSTTKPIIDFLTAEKFKFKLVEDGNQYQINDGEEIYFYHSANDIDSAQVITSNGKSIFNMNDCFLEEKNLQQIGEKFNIEHSFIFFMGVGPFPGSFKNFDNKQKHEIIEKKKQKAFVRAKKSLELLRSKQFTAYSNDMTWPRRKDLVELNGCLKKDFYSYIRAANIESQSISLESGGTIDLETMKGTDIYDIFSSREEMAKSAIQFAERIDIKNQILEYEHIETQFKYNHCDFINDMKNASKEIELKKGSTFNMNYSHQKFILKLYNNGNKNDIHAEILVELKENKFNIREIQHLVNEEIFDKDNIILEVSSDLIGACQAGFYTTEDLTNCRFEISRYKEYTKEEEFFWKFWSLIYKNIVIEKPQFLGLIGD